MATDLHDALHAGMQFQTTLPEVNPTGLPFSQVA
jgi:hypothetical protein